MTRLEDLRVRDYLQGDTPDLVWRERPATVSDLVAALQAEGGDVHQVSIGDDGNLQVDPVLLLDESSSYLVFRLEVDGV